MQPRQTSAHKRGKNALFSHSSTNPGSLRLAGPSRCAVRQNSSLYKVRHCNPSLSKFGPALTLGTSAQRRSPLAAKGGTQKAEEVPVRARCSCSASTRQGPTGPPKSAIQRHADCGLRHVISLRGLTSWAGAVCKKRGVGVHHIARADLAPACGTCLLAWTPDYNQVLCFCGCSFATTWSQ